MNLRHHDLALFDITVPLRERVLERLADLMFDADDLLQMLHSGDTDCIAIYEQSAEMRWIEPHLTNVYEQINALMKKMTH